MFKKLSLMIPIASLFIFLFCGVALYASAEENSATSTDSADSFINAVEKASGGDVIFNLYYDFDGNGTKEMFALVQKGSSDSHMDEEFDVMEGRLWYVDANGAIEVMSQSKPYYKDPKVLEFDGSSVLPLHQMFISSTRTYLWGVLGGKPYELNASGRINGLDINEYGEIEGIGEDYTGGHTWNTYYFYYDHGNIREYGGKEITWEEFCRIPGIEAVKDKIEKEKSQNGQKINSIYYRSNGIVVVNFEGAEADSENYSNIQLRITEDSVKIYATTNDSEFSNGKIASAYLDELATYPETFPY